MKRGGLDFRDDPAYELVQFVGYFRKLKNKYLKHSTRHFAIFFVHKPWKNYLFSFDNYLLCMPGSDIDAAEVDPVISSSNSFPDEANNRHAKIK
jgi:hypothetical protein